MCGACPASRCGHVSGTGRNTGSLPCHSPVLGLVKDVPSGVGSDPVGGPDRPGVASPTGRLKHGVPATNSVRSWGEDVGGGRRRRVYSPVPSDLSSHKLGRHGGWLVTRETFLRRDSESEERTFYVMWGVPFIPLHALFESLYGP